MNPVLSYQTMKNDHLASLHQNLMNHLQHDFQPENTNSAHISYHISQSQPIASTKIKVKGKWVEKGVYPIPLKLLLPNPENFRFRTLLENYLAVNRKTMLNLNDNKDLQIIRRYLKESDPPKNAALKKDVLEKGLKNPIVARLADGRIIEGNRRWNEALDSHNNGEGGPSYIEVAFLEEELSDADILEIEATFQYEPETKSYYKPIEDAQLFRELRKHFSMDYIVNRFNLSEKKIQLRIDTLNLIDDYLSRIGKPSHYSLVTELSSFTSFEEAQKNLYKFVDETPETEQMFRVSSLNTISLGILTKRDNKIGQKRLEENQGNKTDKELTFEHRDIRGLYTIFQDEEARLKLIQHMEPSKIFTLEEMEEKKEQVVSDIYEARMECETNLHLDEPNRLLSLINSNLKKIKTIPSEAGRDEFLNRIKFTTQQMRRILNLVANPIQQEE